MSNDGEKILEKFMEGRNGATLQALWMQLGITAGISVAIIIGFSIVRPRQSKIYAPKIKFQSHSPNDPDYEPPPPKLSDGFLAWLSPVVHVHEKQMILNIGLDAVTFLRLVRMMLYILIGCSIYGVALFGVYIAYNVKNTDAKLLKEDPLSYFTLANVSDGWMWPALGASYVMTFIVMYFVWRNWQAMITLRQDWFRSPQYQRKIYSRTLLITNVPKEYRSDEGLIHLMQQLKVDGIKISQDIDCTAIGRSLADFPNMVDQHNEAVKDLEKVLVKYLRHGKEASKRPMVRKGGFMCCGGRKVDAIDYYAKQIKFLRDQVDERRAKINSLIRQERKARKGGRVSRVQGESYGFITFKTVAEAHRINLSHGGKCRELGGAELQLAPQPNDILWQNMGRDSVELHSTRMIGWILLGALFFAYAIPTALVAFLATLPAFGDWGFIASWRDNSGWTFNLVSGTVGPLVQVIFLFILPIVIRRICKYQGAPTRSRLDRATTARYYFITTVWTLIILSIFSVIYSTVMDLVKQINKHMSAVEILNALANNLPQKIRNAYMSQSNYWLTWLPLRGLLVIYDLIQLLKLVLVSFRRVMFHYTPRDIRELTKPYLFEYHTVSVNLIFVITVALVYAPIAPLVVFGATLVMWFSYIVYKYQLLYVYVSRSESGGRMWNVYVNRVLVATVFMQLLMILTTALIRRHSFDAIAGVPPVIVLLIFKIWMSVTTEPRFKHYRPTQTEIEEQRLAAMREKPTSSTQMERKFLHPALRPNKMFTVMVHKKQEDLARHILAAYPWFEKSHGTQIRGVREENLEYNPDLDKMDAQTEAGDWETRSIASTDLLGGFNDGGSVYSMSVSPMPAHATISQNALVSSPALGHIPNHSTDELLASPAPLGYSRAMNGTDPSLPWAEPTRSASPSFAPTPAYPPYGSSGFPSPYRTESGGSDTQLYYPYTDSPGGMHADHAQGYFPPQQGTYPPEPPYRNASQGYPYQPR